MDFHYRCCARLPLQRHREMHSRNARAIVHFRYICTLYRSLAFALTGLCLVHTRGFSGSRTMSVFECVHLPRMHICPRVRRRHNPTKRGWSECETTAISSSLFHNYKYVGPFHGHTQTLLDQTGCARPITHCTLAGSHRQYSTRLSRVQFCK